MTDLGGWLRPYLKWYLLSHKVCFCRVWRPWVDRLAGSSCRLDGSQVSHLFISVLSYIHLFYLVSTCMVDLNTPNMYTLDCLFQLYTLIGVMVVVLVETTKLCPVCPGWLSDEKGGYVSSLSELCVSTLLINLFSWHIQKSVLIIPIVHSPIRFIFMSLRFLPCRSTKIGVISDWVVELGVQLFLEVDERLIHVQQVLYGTCFLSS